MRYLLGWAGSVNESPQIRRMRSRQEANDDFLLDQRRQLRNERRFIEQRENPIEGIEHRSIEPLYPNRLKCLVLPRPLRLDFGRDLK